MRLRFWRKKPPPPIDLTPYQDSWVAVLKGHVVATSDDAVVMADFIVAKKGAWAGAEVFYVEPSGA